MSKVLGSLSLPARTLEQEEIRRENRKCATAILNARSHYGRRDQLKYYDNATKKYRALCQRKGLRVPRAIICLTATSLRPAHRPGAGGHAAQVGSPLPLPTYSATITTLTRRPDTSLNNFLRPSSSLGARGNVYDKYLCGR